MPTEKAHGLQIFKTCHELVKAGVKLELWVPKRKNIIKDRVGDYYGIKQNFKLKRFLTIDLFRFEKYIGKTAYWLQFFSFYAFVKPRLFFQSRKNIIYTRDWLGIFFRFWGFQIIYECHSIPKKNWSFFTLAKLASKIIVVSQGLKELFLKNGFKEKNILVAPDAVDLSVFDINISKEQARKKLNLPLDKKIIGYTGKFKTMGMDKGISDILKALTKLKDDILFVAVGGSQAEIDYYRKQVQELNLGNKVIFKEHVSQDELAIFQKSCDLLLMPFPDKEHYAKFMSPLKMFEYMASNRPIIATDLPTIKEVLKHLNSEQGNAVLVKPDNPEDLAKGIKELLNNKELSERISNKALKDVKEYTWERRVERIVEFIAE